MNKTAKYLIGVALLGMVAYNSVYFKRLDEVKAVGAGGGTAFAAAPYADRFWNSQLLPKSPTLATDLTTLLSLLKSDKDKAFDAHSQALGIGNIRYFLVKGEGTVTAISPNDVTVTLPSGEKVHLATEFIFGNAARDASGLIKINEFDNTTDLNSVSAELNEIIRKKVVPSLKTESKPGRKLSFIGAMELNRAHLHLDNLTLVPIIVERQTGRQTQ